MNREHDRVTRAVATLVRVHDELWGPGELLAGLVLARVINRADMLMEVFRGCATVADALERAHQLERVGRLVFGRAYHVGRREFRAQKLHEAWLRRIATLPGELRLERWPGTLRGVFAALTALPCIGRFLAHQVCVDVRYLPHHGAGFSDWETFLVVTCGTVRGLGCLIPEGVRGPEAAAPVVLELRDRLRTEVSPELAGHFRDPNNVANCLCEYGKYEYYARCLRIGRKTFRHRRFDAAAAYIRDINTQPLDTTEVTK